MNLPADGSEDSAIHCLKEGQPCHEGFELFKSQQRILTEPDVNPFVIDEEDVHDARPDLEFMIIEEDNEDSEDEIIDIM